MSLPGWLRSGSQTRASPMPATKLIKRLIKESLYAGTHGTTNNTVRARNRPQKDAAPADVDDIGGRAKCGRGSAVFSPGCWLYFRPFKTERDKERTGLDNT